MNKIKAKNEKQLNNKDYFSFASPDKECDKENGNNEANMIKSHYPDSQFYPSFNYNSKNKIEKVEQTNKAEKMRKELNLSLKSGFDQNHSLSKNSKDEVEIFQRKEAKNWRNPLTTDSLNIEINNDKWNERAKRLEKELNNYSSRENNENQKINIEEKLRLLVKTVKRNTLVETEKGENSYKYKKKKRGSSLQRFQEQEKQRIVDEIYQRRSFNNPNSNLQENFNVPKEQTPHFLAMNTILKDNIHQVQGLVKSKRNNKDMPLQKFRMKQSSSYLKNNYVKTNEEIKANLKKKISNHNDMMKKKFINPKLSTKNKDTNTEFGNREKRVQQEIPTKYTNSSSSGTISVSMLKNLEKEKRNRFGNFKNVISYNRIGSKSPATRK